MGRRVEKQGAAPGQRVDRRRRVRGPTENADAIRAQRVDRDNDHVGALAHGSRRADSIARRVPGQDDDGAHERQAIQYVELTRFQGR